MNTSINVSVTRRIAHALEQGVAQIPAGVSAAALLRLVSEALGNSMRRFQDGRMLIWDIARHDGYTIPPYPMAGCGDVREFLRDEGVRNVPEWYERHLGMSRQTYDAIYKYELVMVKNARTYRRVWLIPAQIVGSDLAATVRYAQEWAAFALSEMTSDQDGRLFKR